ncbi:MAG TPA: methylmalonyl Co-A mutase-associated GTPase MeaB [Desulfobacterales bacterium]|nr:methylmalonyl Co-A mutase-associated GTPase MeaB [Desulfobacterales bacterium]
MLFKDPKEPQDYVEGVLAKDKRIIAKTITLIESALPDHKDIARKVISAILPHTGESVRLGITGVPGAGKSTFIEALGMMLIQKGHQVAVLAVDPSSKRSGGSILADKTRMENLSIQEKAFIRPSPSGVTLGGVARKTRETMLICEAAGYDVVLIETVGVGQSETTVASMVDFFLVLMIAGAGDELQGIKKGLLELADALAINKADGDNIQRAKLARRQYETALHFLNPASRHWTPPVLTCSSLGSAPRGIEEIWNTVLKHREIMTSTGEMDILRRQQSLDWMWFLLDEGLKERFNRNLNVKKRLPEIIRDVKNGALEPTLAADQLLFLLDNAGSV